MMRPVLLAVPPLKADSLAYHGHRERQQHAG